MVLYHIVRVKIKPALNFESTTALENIARGLRHARLARAESQITAAARVGVGLATYQRIESADGISGVATGTVLTALCLYGFAEDVLALGAPARDAEGLRLSYRGRVRGRTLNASTHGL